MRNGGTEAVAEMIKNARRAKGLSQSALARRIGAAQQTIEKLETGKVKRSSFLAAIALELDIPVDRIANVGHKSALSGAAASLGNYAASPVVIAGRSLVGETSDLPVYAACPVGGSNVQVLANNPFEYVLRPAPLAKVRDGYGIMVGDETMSPEFRSSDVVLINPHLPPRPGDACVFKRRRDDGTEELVLRHLVAMNEKDWKVVAWHAGEAETSHLRRDSWPIANVVVGTYKRR